MTYLPRTSFLVRYSYVSTKKPSCFQRPAVLHCFCALVSLVSILHTVSFAQVANSLCDRNAVSFQRHSCTSELQAEKDAKAIIKQRQAQLVSDRRFTKGAKGEALAQVSAVRLHIQCVLRFALTLLCCAVRVSLGGESPVVPVGSGDAKSTASGMQCFFCELCVLGFPLHRSKTSTHVARISSRVLCACAKNIFRFPSGVSESIRGTS